MKNSAFARTGPTKALLNLAGKVLTNRIETMVAKRKAGKQGGRMRKKRPSGKQQGNDLGVVTKQHDTSISYRRTKSRKKQLTFQKKVRRAIQNELGDATLCRSLVGTGNSTAGFQRAVDYSMWGQQTPGIYDHDDMTQCFAGYNAGLYPNAYLITQMCNFDWIVSNSGNVPIQLKVITVYAKTDTNQSPRDIWAEQNNLMEGLPNQPSLEGVKYRPPYDTANTLPFTCPEFCRVFTIGEVRKYFLAVGDVASWRDTDKRRMKRLSSDLYQAKFKKGTKFYMLVWHGINTGSAVTTKAGAYPASTLNIMIQKTYKFNVLKDNYNTISASDNV